MGATSTGKARSPTVDNRVRQTICNYYYYYYYHYYHYYYHYYYKSICLEWRCHWNCCDDDDDDDDDDADDDDAERRRPRTSNTNYIDEQLLCVNGPVHILIGDKT